MLGSAACRSPRARKAPHLVEQAGVQHGVEARIQALVQPGAVFGLDADQGPVHARLTRGLRMPFAQGATAAAKHLQRALDALRVAGVQAGGGVRVDPRQLGVQRRPALGLGLGVDLRTQHRFASGEFGEPVAQRLHIEQGAADEQRQPAACGNLRGQALGVAHEGRRRVALQRVVRVDQVMRHGGPLGRRGFGRADVHAAVDQRRVDADDLQRQLLRQRQRGTGLADAGGTDQQHRPCGQRLAQNFSQGAR
jgi:hypothetical protein